MSLSTPKASRRSLPGTGSGRKTSGSVLPHSDLWETAAPRHAQHRHHQHHSQHHHHHHHHQQHQHQHSYFRGISQQRRSSPSTASSSSTSSHGRQGNGNNPADHFVSTNYRFIVRRAAQGHSSPKSPGTTIVDWDTVECVIIPVFEDPKCPICLDIPVAPKVTQCGHYFCWTCLLRYLVVSVPESPTVSRNWRSCPVCADQFNQKKIKPVHFFRSLPVSVGGWHEFCLVGRSACAAAAADNAQQYAAAAVAAETPTGLSPPSPFVKICAMEMRAICEHVWLPERHELIERMHGMADCSGVDDVERYFIEQALSALSDRHLGSDSDSGGKSAEMTVAGASSTGNSAGSSFVQSEKGAVFFHQSADGQYVFLDSLSIRILKAHYGAYERLPRRLSVRIKGMEEHVMGEGEARRYRYLSGYIPAGAVFHLCEVDLAGVVADAVLAQFGREIAIRKEARDARTEREEAESMEAARRSSLDDGYGYVADGIAAAAGDDYDGGGGGSYKEDLVNFPLPPGEVHVPVKPAVWCNSDAVAEQQSEPRSLAATMPASPPSPFLLFNLSLDELVPLSSSSLSSASPPSSGLSPSSSPSPQSDADAGHGRKKGRSKYVLIGGGGSRRR